MERQEMVTFSMNWLAQPDIDGPRLLKFTSYSHSRHESATQTIESIREVIIYNRMCTFSIEFNSLAIPCRQNTAHICRQLGTLPGGRKTSCRIPSDKWHWWRVVWHMDRNWTGWRCLPNHPSPSWLEHERNARVDRQNGLGTLALHLDWTANHWVKSL